MCEAINHRLCARTPIPVFLHLLESEKPLSSESCRGIGQQREITLGALEGYALLIIYAIGLQPL